MKTLNKAQFELLQFLSSNRLVLIPTGDNKGSPTMIDSPYEKIRRSTLSVLQDRRFMDDEEEIDGYTTTRITKSGIAYLRDRANGPMA